MNLIIDAGNTLVKLVVFNKKEMVFHKAFPDLNTEIIDEILHLYPIDKTIYSDTRGLDIEKMMGAFPEIKVNFALTTDLPLPIQLNYKTPESLGKDRIAAAVGANLLFPGTPVLIVGIGTAITIDFISRDGIYQGGVISPGLDLRFKALHQFTGKLPLVKPTTERGLCGFSTETSIQFGVQNGIVFEINEYIRSYQEKYPGIKVVLSGGYAQMFDKMIKNPIFVEEFLVSIGLNAILAYHTNLETN
jgi:type III pantothenate kinase